MNPRPCSGHRLDYCSRCRDAPTVLFVTDTSVSGCGGDASMLFHALCLSKYVRIYDFRKLSIQMVWTVGTLTHLLIDMSVHAAAAKGYTKI
jgi:hypothetical protein